LAQDHLAYQVLADTYKEAQRYGVVKDTDSDEVVAGMIYVSWRLGVGAAGTKSAPGGAGAYAWRYHGFGDNGANYFNTGRYAVTMLSL
jgi:hypothetical protein